MGKIADAIMGFVDYRKNQGGTKGVAKYYSHQGI